MISNQDEHFKQEMDIHRHVTVALVGKREEDLTDSQRAALDAYELAYQTYYLNEFGKAGPRGAVLREETQAETETRQRWEESVQPHTIESEA